MAATSAGVLLWRWLDGQLEVLIVHPGGPFWAKKDEGAWSIPKGEFDPDVEEGLMAAQREFAEELGSPAPDGRYVELGTTKLKSGKVIHAWAIEGDLDASTIVSNTFELEWPPRSGRLQVFPEVDRAVWLPVRAALTKLNPAQGIFLERLAQTLN